MTTPLIEHPAALAPDYPAFVRAADDAVPPAPPLPSASVAEDRPPHRKASFRSRRLAAGALALGIAVSSGAGGALAVTSRVGTISSTTETATTSTASSATGSTAVSSLATVLAKVTPAVVGVVVQSGQGEAEGSGVVLRSDGTIVTNAHVVDGASGGASITVMFSDGREASATVVGTDAAADLAVIKASGVSGLTTAALGTISGLSVGDSVVAIGNPLGLEGTVTAGVVSALNRTITVSREDGSTETLSGAVQIDAAINPGNSGGALVEAQGRVVGITTANASVSATPAGSIGVGFAISIDRAKQVVDQILAAQ
jgi:putative serine protease PepD